MEKRIECFLATDIDVLQNNINKFLEESCGKLHDIKFTHNEFNDWETFSALLIYTPEGE